MSEQLAKVLRFRPKCRTCGELVEPERCCYAIPTCFKCLPPPAPLPVDNPRSMR